MTVFAAFLLTVAVVTGHWWLAVPAAICAGCAIAEVRRLDRLEREADVYRRRARSAHPAGKGR